MTEMTMLLIGWTIFAVCAGLGAFVGTTVAVLLLDRRRYRMEDEWYCDRVKRSVKDDKCP